MDNEFSGIKVNIRKARISDITFCFDMEGLPTIKVGLYLQTASGQDITYLTLESNAYNENRKLTPSEIDPFVYTEIADIVTQLMPVAIRRINGVEKLLGDGGKA